MKLKALVYVSLITLVASLSLAAHAQNFQVIHAFTGSEGAYPGAGVTLKAGILFGTTYGDNISRGSVYETMQAGSNWLTVPIYRFGSGEGFPRARVVFGPDGKPYGTGYGRNSRGFGNNGTVFDLTPPFMICKTAACFWTESVLHSFADYPTDGANPSGDLIWDQQGNIYGTTQVGSLGSADFGTVFQMTKTGDTWREIPIWSFSYTDGANPIGGVIFDNNGNLIGTAGRGGANTGGTVFKLTPSGNSWTESTIYDFQGATDGNYPGAGLIIDSSGNIYGTTSNSGSGGGGTVFELIPSGNSYTFKLLYSFSGQLNDLCGPNASLSMDTAGNIYGTTVCDGPLQDGNVFKLTHTGNGWVYTSLHDFTGGSDGREPVSNVTIDTDGALYGTASGGGDPTCSCGTIWMIKP